MNNILQPRERGVLMQPSMAIAVRRERYPKTQTRRVVDPNTNTAFAWVGGVLLKLDEPAHRELAIERCPYARVGDRLYVKEACWMWCERVPNGTTPTGRPKYHFVPAGQHVVYCAGGTRPTAPVDDQPNRLWRWKSARFMPRWASRITLEVTDVRVQRVQDISEEDALAEGIARNSKDGTTWKYGLADRDGWPGTDDVGWPWDQWERTARDAFRKLWDSINGERPDCSWDANPWVWAVTFKRVAEQLRKGA